MSGDGNCLFRALAHPGGDHEVVRACVVRHIDAHWDEQYRHFVPSPERAAYRVRMRRSGTWGDELTLRAFSDVARRPVQVLDARPPHRILSTYGAHLKAPVRRVVYDGAHYDAVV